VTYELDRCTHCGEIAGPLGLRSHPRFSLKVAVVKHDPEGDGTYLDLAAFYSHSEDDMRALASRFPREDIVAVERWGGSTWVEINL
jgi:hypothetical protein